MLCQQGSVAFCTKDHRPNDISESKRIEDLGGFFFLFFFSVWFVLNLNFLKIKIGQIVDGRVSGKLSVTRALGDSNLAPFVIALPDVYEQQISALDEFIVLASDGVWDVLTPEEIVQLVSTKLKRNVFFFPSFILMKET